MRENSRPSISLSWWPGGAPGLRGLLQGALPLPPGLRVPLSGGPPGPGPPPPCLPPLPSVAAVRDRPHLPPAQSSDAVAGWLVGGPGAPLPSPPPGHWDQRDPPPPVAPQAQRPCVCFVSWAGASRVLPRTERFCGAGCEGRCRLPLPRVGRALAAGAEMAPAASSLSGEIRAQMGRMGQRGGAWRDAPSDAGTPATSAVARDLPLFGEAREEVVVTTVAAESLSAVLGRQG